MRDALLPGNRGHNDFAVRMGHDAVLVDPAFGKTSLPGGRYLSEWGYVGQKTHEEHGIEVESPIKTMADFERYTPPDPDAPGRYTAIEEALQTYGDQFAVIVHLNDVFSLPRYLMGMESLLMAIVAEPELVTALVDMSVDINLKLAKEVRARGVEIVYTGDDYASNSGPLMSPRHFRKLFYPGLVRLMHGIKELDLYVIKHTDGNLWPIIDLLVDSGIDCLDPIDPQAGMDIADVRAKYPMLTLKGNVDCAQLMTFGTPADIVAATRETLAKGMAGVSSGGGGFICSSSNSIHSGVTPENYLALLDTVRRYGCY
ncbi:MAG: uroporphyrinogen decarboxylase family protein [Nitrososphaerales archaeon]